MIAKISKELNFSNIYNVLRYMIVLFQYVIFIFCAVCAWDLVEVEEKHVFSYHINLLILNYICLPLVIFSQIMCLTTEPGFLSNNKVNAFYAQLSHLTYTLYKIHCFLETYDLNCMETNYFNSEFTEQIYRIKETLYYLDKYYVSSTKNFNCLSKVNFQSLDLNKIEAVENKFSENTDKIDKILVNFSENLKFLDIKMEGCKICKGGFKYERTHHCSMCQKYKFK
jgi:hypothetical protein